MKSRLTLFDCTVTADLQITMLKNPRQRRFVGLLLIAFGGLLMLLAPEVWSGLIMIVIAMILEGVGIALEHMEKNQEK